MSILGLTIDYGPYGWLDRYDPHHVCNGSDDSGRYDFAAQPEVGRRGDGNSRDAGRCLAGTHRLY